MIKKTPVLCAFMLCLVAQCRYFEPKKVANNPKNWLYNKDTNLVLAIGRIEPALKIIPIYAQASGIVQKIRVQNGDWANKNDVLIELDNQLEMNQIDKIKAKINTLQTYNATTNLINIERTRLRCAHLQQIFERFNRSFQSNQEMRQNVDNAQNDYQQALIDLKQAEAVLKNTNAQLQELYADLSLAKTMLAKRKIFAPCDGKLQDLSVSIGFMVSSNSKLAEFVPESSLIVRGEIDEFFSEKIQKKQKIIVREPKNSDTLAVGQISDVAPNICQRAFFSNSFEQIESPRVREIQIKLEQPTRQYLRIGRQVEILIFL